MGSIPGPGGSPGEENGYSLQYSCLENSMDRGAWWAAVHGVTRSQTCLKWLSTHAHEPVITVSVLQSSFTALKTLCALPRHSSFLLPTTGNH